MYLIEASIVTYLVIF